MIVANVGTNSMSDIRWVCNHLLLIVTGATVVSACAQSNADPNLSDDSDGIATDGETGGPNSNASDGSGDGDGDGDGDSQQDPPTCEATTAIATSTPFNVMLVIDKSRSMVNYSWDDDGNAETPDVTRWASLHATVDTISGQYQDAMHLGLTLFPSIDATSDFNEACLVNDTPEVLVGLGNAEAILAAIPAADDTDLYGATPAAAGITTALTHLQQLDDGRPAAIILVTDGAANCGANALGLELFDNYDQDLPQIVADAYENAGIPTYVVGIDIQEESEHPFTKPREKLDELAKLGGVPQPGEVGFYDAANAEALQTALDDIASSVTCGINLGEAPSNPDQLVVWVDGKLIPRLDSCDEGDGWIFSTPDGPLDRIELCNGSCDALLEIGEIEAEFLCPPQP